MKELFTGIGAFAICFAVSLAVYFISRLILKSSSKNALSALPLVRQAINVAVFVAGYFIGDALGLPVIPLIIGAAIGLTLPNIALTFKLSSEYAKNASHESGQNFYDEKRENEEGDER